MEASVGGVPQQSFASAGAKRPREQPLPHGGRRDRVGTLLASLDGGGNEVRAVCTLVLHRRHTLGYACLTGDDGGIVRCGQVHEHVSSGTACAALVRALPRPLALVIPTKFPEGLLAALRAASSVPSAVGIDEGDHAESGNSSEVLVMTHLPATEFSASAAADALRVMWPERPYGEYAGRIGLDKAATAMALGALLTVLHRRGTPIVDVAPMALGAVVAMPPETMHELGVFRSEAHPAAARGVGCAREGLSVFGLADRCKTPEGRALLRRWFLLPTSDAATIEPRKRAIRCLTQPHNRESLSRVMTALRSVRPTARIVARIAAARHTANDYRTLCATAEAALAIAHELYPLCHERASFAGDDDGAAQALPPEIVFDAAYRLCSDLDGSVLRDLISIVTATVDFQAAGAANAAGARASTGGASGGVGSPMAVGAGGIRCREGAHPTVDQHRAAYGTLDAFLTRVAQRELAGLPADFTFPLTVAFFPQAGYVVHVEADAPATSTTEGSGGGDAGNDGVRFAEFQREGPSQLFPTLSSIPDGWSVAFTAPGHTYFKTPRTAELDATVGDLHAAALEAELDVIRTLDERVLGLADALQPLSWLAEIDATTALAAAAIEEGWTEPSFTSPGGRLELIGCTHPLLSRTTSASAVVPFDFVLRRPAQSGASSSSSSSNVAIVTGANGSGKSMLLQAAALTVYLAHIGSFVPCAAAAVPLVDAIVVNDHCTVTAAQALAHCPTSSIASNGRNGASGTTGPKTAACATSALAHSSYGHEIATVGRIVRSWTSQSLVLLDEFGSGTLAADGVALLASIVRHALPPARKPACVDDSATLRTTKPVPLLMVATHYTEMLTASAVDPAKVHWITMRVAVHPEKVAAIRTLDDDDDDENDAYEDDDGFALPARTPFARHQGAGALPGSGASPVAAIRLDPAEVRPLHTPSRTPAHGSRRLAASHLRPPAPSPLGPPRRPQPGTHGGGAPDDAMRDPQFDDVVAPTFVPVPGSHRTSHSSALSCARVAGMDPAIVARAASILAQCSHDAKRHDNARHQHGVGSGGLMQFFRAPPPLGTE